MSAEVKLYTEVTFLCITILSGDRFVASMPCNNRKSSERAIAAELNVAGGPLDKEMYKIIRLLFTSFNLTRMTGMTTSGT